MIYLLVSIISIFIFSKSNRNTRISYWYLFTLFIFNIIIWVLLLGFQNGVGTDYEEYINIFSKSSIANRYKVYGEYLFYFLAMFVQNNNLPPQVGFIFIAFLQAIFFFKFIKKIEIINISLFLFLFFFLSTSFINQMNVLRQYLSVYLFMLSCIYLLDKKYIKTIVLFIVAYFFHRSTLYTIPFLILLLSTSKKEYSNKVLIITLFVSFVFSMIGLEKLVLKVINLTPYGFYIGSDFFSKRIGLVNKITKYLWLPLYVYSLYKKNYFELNKRESLLYQIGFFSYCIKIFSLSFFMFTRFAFFFDILLILPIYYLLCYLKRNKDICTYSMILFSLFFIFSLKVLFFPVDEYIYKSIISIY